MNEEIAIIKYIPKYNSRIVVYNIDYRNASVREKNPSGEEIVSGTAKSIEDMVKLQFLCNQATPKVGIKSKLSKSDLIKKAKEILN